MAAVKANEISPMREEACAICKQPFARRARGGNIYCGAKCKRESERLSRLRKRASEGLPSVGDMVQCVKCGLEFRFSGGSAAYCGASCRRLARIDANQRFRAENPDAYKAFHRKADDKRLNDPSRRTWRRDYTRIASREKRSTAKGCLNHRMSQAVRAALGNGKGGATWFRIVGYSIDDLAAHLERQFVSGMSWSNIGEWHIDHIVPKASFTYAEKTDPEFKACWAITNLRPLWRADNLQKGCRREYLL